MPEPNRPSPPTLSRVRWLALPAALVFTGVSVLVLWWRSQDQPHDPAPVLPVPLAPEPSVPVESPRPSEPPAPVTRQQSPLRWLLYFGAALIIFGVLTILEDSAPELSLAVGIGLVLALCGYGLYRSADQIRHGVRIARFELVELRDVFKRLADIITAIMIAAALWFTLNSAVLLRDSISYEPSFGDALFMFMLATAALGIALAFKGGRVLPAQWCGEVPGIPAPARPFDWRRASRALIVTGSGVFLLFLLAVINYNPMNTSLLVNVHHVVQLALLAFGILLLVIGLGGRVRLPVMTRREQAALAVVLLVTVALRLWALDTAIPRFVDEVNFMEAIPRLWAVPNTRILVPFSDLTAFTWLYPIFQSGFSSVLGSGMYGLRLISVIFGTLGVMALYFLVRTAFHDIWLALTAALILATFPAHLHFSRLGLNNIADPFFGTLALAFLVRGLQSHQRADYILAGASLGLTQYFYEGGRLLYPPLFVCAFVISWLLSGHRRADLIHAAYALLVAVLIAAPVYYTLIGSHSFLAPRLEDRHIKVDLWAQFTAGFDYAVRLLRERFLYPLLMYTSITDLSWFYGGAQPLVMMSLVPVFLIGVAYSLWRLRSPIIPVLLGWLVATALGNGILAESLWVPRYVVVFPALAVFLALGIHVALKLAWPSARLRRWLYPMMAAVTVALSAVQTSFYFREQVPTFLQQLADEDWNDAFFRMIKLPSGTHVHIIMEEPVWRFNIIAFSSYFRLNLVIDALHPQDVTPAYLDKISGDATVQHVFFINSARTHVLARLRRYFVLDPPQMGADFIPAPYQLALYHARVARRAALLANSGAP